MTQTSLLPEAAGGGGHQLSAALRADHRAFARGEGAQTRRETASRTNGRASRNQRVSNTRQRQQQHLLDVKVRSHKATSIAITASSSSRRKCCSRSLTLRRDCSSACATASKQLFFDNPDYRLSKIEVQTDGTLQRDQVLKDGRAPRRREHLQRESRARARSAAAAAAGR